MANVQIPNLPVAISLNGAEQVEVVQAGTSVRTTTGQIADLVTINVNYINSQEFQTATAGQTVFTLTTMQYQPGTRSLSVFVDGVNQYGPGASYAYQETSSTVVTFTAGLNVGAEVKFTTSAINTSSYGDAQQVSYTPPFTNSISTNVEAKLAQTVSVVDFGAVGDGSTDDRQAFINALATGKVVFAPKGAYFISDQLTLENNTLIGEGQGVFVADARTILLFPANKNGLNLTGQGTCRISELCVASQSTVAGTGVGIRVASHGSLVENVLITNFASHGLQITCTPPENANNCLIKLVRSIFNSGNGFVVGPGADPNACSLVMCDASDNTGIGFYSNAANTVFDHCHAANNGDVDFDEASGSNLFLWPYSEDGFFAPTFRVSNAVPTGSFIMDAPFGEVGLSGNTTNISRMRTNSFYGGIAMSSPFWVDGGAGLYGFTNDATYGFTVYDRTNNRFVKQWNLTQTQERNRALIMSDLGFGVVEGANKRQGVVTLVGGTATVANTSAGASSRIFLTSQVDGGTPGFLRVSSRIDGTSFTIQSSSATDTSTVAYVIFEPGVASGTTA